MVMQNPMALFGLAILVWLAGMLIWQSLHSKNPLGYWWELLTDLGKWILIGLGLAVVFWFLTRA